MIEGTFIDGLIIRQWIDSNGNEYEGNCNFNIQAHGKCKVKHSNNDCYDGEWYYGLKQGKGIYSTQDGPAFQGQWDNDKLVEYKMLGDAALYEGYQEQLIQLPAAIGECEY